MATLTSFILKACSFDCDVYLNDCPHEEQVAASVGPEIKVDYEEATAKPFSLNFTELGCLFFLKLKICFA